MSGKSSQPRGRSKPASPRGAQERNAMLLDVEHEQQALAAARIKEEIKKIRSASKSREGRRRTTGETIAALQAEKEAAGKVINRAAKALSIENEPVEIVEEVRPKQLSAAKVAAKVAAKTKLDVPFFDRILRMLTLGLSLALALFVFGQTFEFLGSTVGVSMPNLARLSSSAFEKLGLPAPAVIAPRAMVPVVGRSNGVLVAASSLRYTVLLPPQILTWLLSFIGGELAAKYAGLMEMGFVTGAILAALAE